jgi:hypothetical protein
MPHLQLEFPKDLLVVESILDRPGAVTQLSSVSDYLSTKLQDSPGEIKLHFEMTASFQS